MPKTDIPGHRIYLDLSKVTIKMEASDNATISRDNWKVLVCEATGKKWSDFTVTKSKMVEQTCEHLHKMKSRGIWFATYGWTQRVRITSLQSALGIANGLHYSPWISNSRHVKHHNTTALPN